MCIYRFIYSFNIYKYTRETYCYFTYTFKVFSRFLSYFSICSALSIRRLWQQHNTKFIIIIYYYFSVYISQLNII